MWSCPSIGLFIRDVASETPHVLRNIINGSLPSAKAKTAGQEIHFLIFRIVHLLGCPKNCFFPAVSARVEAASLAHTFTKREENEHHISNFQSSLFDQGICVVTIRWNLPVFSLIYPEDSIRSSNLTFFANLDLCSFSFRPPEWRWENTLLICGICLIIQGKSVSTLLMFTFTTNRCSNSSIAIS